MQVPYTAKKQLTNVRHKLIEKEEKAQSTLELADSYPNAFNALSQANASTIADYIQSMKIELNLSDHYKRDVVLLLCKFSKYYSNKSFKNLTREDVLVFLNRFIKKEQYDPLHKWIGTYNIYRQHLLRFFKWLYYPNDL